MEFAEAAALVSRWIHIFFAAVAVGGTVMARFALAPAAREVGGSDEVANYRDAVRRKWMKWVMAAIMFLLLSGTYTFIAVYLGFKHLDQKLPGWYHALFGTKVILAMIVFYISSVLVGKSESAQRARQNEIRWLTVNLILMVVIVCLAGVLRLAHNEPDVPVKAVQTTTHLVGSLHG